MKRQGWKHSGMSATGFSSSSPYYRRNQPMLSVVIIAIALAFVPASLILRHRYRENMLYQNCLHECIGGNATDTAFRRCAIIRQGGSTRCRQHDISLRSAKLPVKIYQQYHNKTTYSEMYDGTSSLYRGLAQAPGAIRQGYDDIDSTLYLDILKDSLYQNQLCEYSGFFALMAGGFVSSQPEPYIGFQSWKARRKHNALSCRAEKVLVESMDDKLRKKQDTFFFWGFPTPWKSRRRNKTLFRLYWGCEQSHKDCLDVFRAGFSSLFGSKPPDGLEDGLPPIPVDDGGHWAYMSYFAMPTWQLEKYLRFAALFFAALDHHYYDKVSNGTCPHRTPHYSPEYQGQHCFCFMMERLVNVWAYHTGLNMVYLEPRFGEMREVHPVSKRTRPPALAAWFADENVRTMKYDVAQRLARANNRRVVEQLLTSEFSFVQDSMQAFRYTLKRELGRVGRPEEVVEELLEEAVDDGKRDQMAQG